MLLCAMGAPGTAQLRTDGANKSVLVKLQGKNALNAEANTHRKSNTSAYVSVTLQVLPLCVGQSRGAEV